MAEDLEVTDPEETEATAVPDPLQPKAEASQGEEAASPEEGWEPVEEDSAEEAAAGEATAGDAVAEESDGDYEEVPEDEAPTEEGPSVEESVDEESTAGPQQEDEAEDGDSSEAQSSGAEAGESSPEGDSDEDPEEATSTRLGPGAHLDDDELQRRLSALLFASPDPISLGKLVVLLERPPRPRVKAALDALDQRFESAGLPFQVRGLKGGFTLMSTPEVGPVLSRLAKGQAVERVSAAALETLSVVAYRQPVTKAEIEAIRGVQAGPILRSLVDRGLIKVAGRADVPGHPLQYATTKDFLDRFGLMTLADLPRDAELTQD